MFTIRKFTSHEGQTISYQIGSYDPYNNEFEVFHTVYIKQEDYPKQKAARMVNFLNGGNGEGNPF